MKKIALIAAIAAAVAAPAFAQSNSTAFAIAHFNQSAESASDIVTLPSGANTNVVSTRGSGTLATTFDILNRSAATMSDLRGLNSATVVNGTPTYGADIFARLRAAALEDE